jgi:DNA-binding PadR family transcriptional regulator
MPKRHRARWTASELNRLHNEYEMKELTVQEIADLHGRTVYGVMSKLQAEGLIDSSWNNARGWVFQSQGQSSKQSLSLQPALQFDQDDDTESVEQDDPEDEDYVPEEEEEEEDDAEDDEEEFDPYSMKQKVAFLEQQITNIFSFLQKQFPKQKVMSATP